MIADDVAEALSDARALVGELGLRPYAVESVRVRWSGGERGRGEPCVVCTCRFEPAPRVELRPRRELGPAGTSERGTAVLTEIAPMPEEALLAMLGQAPLEPGEETWVEIVSPGGTRRRYAVAEPPERRPFDWRVVLRAQDTGRDPSGRVPSRGAPGAPTFGIR